MYFYIKQDFLISHNMFGASSAKCINKRSFVGVFLVGKLEAQDFKNAKLTRDCYWQRSFLMAGFKSLK